MSHIYNPDNPYVINPNYFNNVTNLRYEQTLLSKIHYSINLLAFLVGTSAALLLIFLALKKTPKHFKDYSHLILVCALFDLLYVWLDFLTQFRIKFAQNFMFASAGVVKYLPYYAQCHVLITFANFQHATFFLMTYGYGYRYILIKSNKPPTWIQKLCYLFICLSIGSFNYFIQYKTYCVMTDDAGQIDYAKNWYQERGIPKLMIAMNKSTFLGIGISTVVYMAILNGNYLFSILFAYMTKSDLNRQTSQLQSTVTIRTVRLRKQFSNVLLCQGIVPLLTVLLPTMIGLNQVNLGYNTNFISEYYILSMTFHPVLNPIINICLVSPYRHFCLKVFMKVFKKSSFGSVSDISSTQNNMNVTAPSVNF